MSEKIIYALSTLGEVGLSKFYDLFKRLNSPEDNEDYNYNIRYQTVRYLESLGYCEFDYDQRRVYMCPPTLVLLPSYGLPKALLTGARTPKLIDQIKNSVKKRKEQAIFKRFKQKNAQLNLPDAAIIESLDAEIIKEISVENGISSALERPVALDLVNHSVCIGDIEKKLKYELRTEINWQRKDFNVQRLGFIEGKDNEEYRLSEYVNPDNQQRKHWVWNLGKAADVNRDWGRYLVLKHSKRNILFYDEETQEFQIPLWVPVPCLLARVLTLCSGMAPVLQPIKDNINMPQGCLMQVYSDVPVEIATLVANKLEQKI